MALPLTPPPDSGSTQDTMTSASRIAILECDTPLPQVEQRRGSYGDIFTALLRTAGLSTGASHAITSYNIVDDPNIYPSLSDVDAILLTGSKYNAFDSDEWILRLIEYVKMAISHKKRILGICFGHQILGRALGCKVGRSDIGWEVSAVPITMTPLGKQIFGQSTLSIMQMHRDIVEDVPPEAALLASTDRCSNQGFFLSKRYLTFQGHPEFTRDIVEELVQARYQLLGQELHDDALKRCSDQNDGPLIAKIMVQFLEGNL